MKNRITGTSFIRRDEKLRIGFNEAAIILHLEKDIPAIGYGAKEIRKMLKETIVPVKKKFPRTKSEARAFIGAWHIFVAQGHPIEDANIFLENYEE